MVERTLPGIDVGHPVVRRYRGKPGAGPVTITAGRRTAWLTGDGIPHVLNRAGIDQRMWDPTRRCWCIPVSRLWEALAVVERKLHREVELIEVDR